jgi:hypothetical protein
LAKRVKRFNHRFRQSLFEFHAACYYETIRFEDLKVVL